MPDTPIPGVDLLAQRTQALRVPIPMWKRGKLWALVAFALLLVLWEFDARYAGAVFSWFGSLFDWIMAHPILPCGISLLVGHYCWPESSQLVSARRRVPPEEKP